MIFKYFVSFSGDGEMECFCKFKHDCKKECKKECKEYIVKLSVIDRNRESEISINNLDINKISKIGNSINRFSKDIKVFNNEINSVSKSIKKINKTIKGIKI